MKKKVFYFAFIYYLFLLSGLNAKTPFIRGDANADSKIDLSDAITILQYLFLDKQEPPCLKSLDTNGQGEIDLSSAVYLLFYFYAGTAPPPAPQECGYENFDKGLTCTEFSPCKDVLVTEAEGIVGSVGGEVTVTDPDSSLAGVSVLVPEGALPENTRITIAVDRSPPVVQLPDGMEREGDCISFESSEVFTTPLVIKIPVLARNNLNTVRAVYSFNNNTNSWEHVTPLPANGPNIFYGNADHFSKFAKATKTMSIDPILSTFDIKVDALEYCNNCKGVVPCAESDGVCEGMCVLTSQYFNNYKNSGAEKLRSRWTYYKSANAGCEVHKYIYSKKNPMCNAVFNMNKPDYSFMFDELKISLKNNTLKPMNIYCCSFDSFECNAHTVVPIEIKYNDTTSGNIVIYNPNDNINTTNIGFRIEGEEVHFNQYNGMSGYWLRRYTEYEPQLNEIISKYPSDNKVAYRFVNDVNNNIIEFVKIPPGSFMMGSPETVQAVNIDKGFYLGVVEVTQNQYYNVFNSFPSAGTYRPYNPVDTVTWYDAKEFCSKLNSLDPDNIYCLPTDAQWEYACRAGSDGPYAGTGNLDDMGWYRGNSEDTTHLVGTKHPNHFGLYDMHGNVLEWTQDKSLRGGSFWQDADSCQSWRIDSWDPEREAFPLLGFRVIRLLNKSDTNNHCPVANNGESIINVNLESGVCMRGHDDDGDGIKFIVKTKPQHGKLNWWGENQICHPGRYYSDGWYIPDPGFIGRDQITFTTHDGECESTPAVYEINVIIAHDVSPPKSPSGSSCVAVNMSENYCTGDSVCSKGHSVQYWICWDFNGNFANNTNVTPCANYLWTEIGVYQVAAFARCSEGVESAFSNPLAVVVYSEVVGNCDGCVCTTTDDTYVTDGSRDSHGNETGIGVGSVRDDDPEMVGYFKFDVSCGANHSNLTAELKLYCDHVNMDGALFYMYPVNGSWNEDELSCCPEVSWDITQQLTANMGVAASTGEWMSIKSQKINDLVKKWISGAAVNNGVVLRVSCPECQSKVFGSFVSKEGNLKTPQLILRW